MSSLALRRDRATSLPQYERHKPEQTLLYQIIEKHYPDFSSLMEEQGRPLPFHVKKEFDDFLKCGRLEHGFIRVQCTSCHKDGLVAFSCKRRGFCPSCGARRMAESAALLVDDVLPEQPVRQWVLSFPFQLRFLFASNPGVMSQVLGIVYRVISGALLKKAGFTRKNGMAGAVTLVQRFGSALNLNPNAARFTSTCCFSTVSTAGTSTGKSYFGEPRPRRRMNCASWSTRSVCG